jgi:hypothetical protein
MRMSIRRPSLADPQEGSMRVVDAVKAGIAGITRLMARRRRTSGFICGECERWERCGLPPNKNCIVMAAQIARDGERPVKRRILAL